METKQREREHPGHSRGLDPGHARRQRFSVRPGREWGRGGPGVGERRGTGSGWRPSPATRPDRTGSHGCAGPAAAALWLGRPAERCPPEPLSAPRLSVVAGGGRRAGRGSVGPARASPTPPGICPGTTGGPGVPSAGLGRCPGPSRGRRDQRPSAVAGAARRCPVTWPSKTEPMAARHFPLFNVGLRSPLGLFYLSLAASRGDFLS